MSLINDALKRASQTIQQRGPGPAGGKPLQHVETEARPPWARLVLLPLLVILALGGWFFWKSRPPAPQAGPTLAASNPPISPRPAAAPSAPVPAPNPARPMSEPVATNAAVTQPAPRPELPPRQTNAPAVAIATVATNAPAPATNLPPVAKAPAKPAPVFPALKLEAIYYRRVRPSAMINGRNVSVGDTIEGVKVIAIERQSVTVKLEGETKDLLVE